METPVSSITSQGDLGGQKVKMSFDENSLAHLMSVLTDLYSDPQLAVIREYSTNALDAHIEAGITDPIEIFTPSAYSPYFKIVDHGVGLSVDDITDMYSKYGASSKRGTNDQVGMLGLGAKSALTLVPQFTLVSVKNGVKISVSISRNSDGAGQMEIIDTVATTDSNGVTIQIPVPRNHTFTQKCEDFFRFWKKGTVLVDGKEPAFISGRPVGENFIVNNKLRQDYVVMGNVPYPVKEGLYNSNNYGYGHMGIVAFVKIGDVNFTPSREQLHYTTKTKETIARLRRDFQDQLTASVQKDIDASADHFTAWQRAGEWRDSFSSQFRALTYKGSIIPSSLNFTTYTVKDAKGQDHAKSVNAKSISIYSNTRYNYSFPSGVNTTDGAKHIYITGFAESLKASPVQREKVAAYLESKGLAGIKHMVLTTHDKFFSPDDMKWLKDFHFADWKADIAPIKIARNTAGNKIIRTDPYDLYDGQYGSKQVPGLDTTKPIVYYSTADLRYPSWLPKMVEDDAQIVILSKNRWEKFQRDYPTALEYRAAIKAKQEKLIKQMTNADRIIWHHNGYRHIVRKLDYKLIDDPDLHEFVKVLSTPNLDFSPAAKILRDEMSRREAPSPDVTIPVNPLTKYPLLGNMRENEVEHLYWYLNTFYAQLKAEADKENNEV
jgi:hypothetical protein